MNLNHNYSLHEFSDLISQIYRYGSEGDFNHYCLPSLATNFSSEAAALVRMSDSAERDRIFASIGFNQFQLRTMMVNTRSYGCSIFSTDKRKSENVFASPKVQSRGPCADHPGGKHWLMGVVTKSPSHVSLIWFSREADLGEYSSGERELLELLLPHLQNATEVSDDVTDLNMKIDAAEQILNRTPFGIFFLDVDGTVLFKNGIARQLLKAKDCFKSHGNRLTLLKNEHGKKLKEYLDEFANCSDPLTMGRRNFTVQSLTGDKQYNVVFIPMKTTQNSGLRRGDKIVLLQIHNPEPIDQGQLDGLETFYNLTAAEIKVCQRLYVSKSLTEAAESLELSINTVKTHLIRSFRKIGVSSQAELLQKLALHPKSNW